MIPYGCLDFHVHWLKQKLIAKWHHAITRANIDTRLHDIH